MIFDPFMKLTDNYRIFLPQFHFFFYILRKIQILGIWPNFSDYRQLSEKINSEKKTNSYLTKQNIYRIFQKR